MAGSEQTPNPGEFAGEGQPRLADELALQLAIETLQNEKRSGTEHLLAQCVVDLMDDKQRFRRFHELVKSAVEYTKPPEKEPPHIVNYGGPGEIEAEPWSWLAALVNEHAADYKPDQPFSGVSLEEALTMQRKLRAAKEHSGSTDAQGYRGMPMSKELLDDLARQAQEDVKREAEERQDTDKDEPENLES